jgi:hypothetical protein
MQLDHLSPPPRSTLEHLFRRNKLFYSLQLLLLFDFRQEFTHHLREGFGLIVE